MTVPWDIYVDDRKVKSDFALGFLAVPNSPSFTHKLWLCRFAPTLITGAKEFRPHEVKWNRPRLDMLPVTEQWIYRVFQHTGVRFYRRPWLPGQTKEFVVLDFLSRFCRVKRLKAPFNVVTFLDFDNEHAAANIQNSIRRTGNIARCYHLDSLNNDCLQCADLLLGATSLLWDDPKIRHDYAELRLQHIDNKKLTDSNTKRYLAGFLASHIDADKKRVYDLRSRTAVSD
ncbi:MAG: hypothetical protein K8S99_16380 [Planctomycetes bacterium]|nr:hypothetical protein [Planctomycetota bacterium]